jgi:hypothetical protein
VLLDDVRALALMLPEVSEAAHMGHPDFRVGGKIFATLWPDEERAVVKLSPEMQAVMVEAKPEIRARPRLLGTARLHQDQPAER